MTDKFDSLKVGLNSPFDSGFEITPDDSADLAVVTRGLNVASSGTVRVTLANGDVVSFFVAAGIAFPARVRRVHQTGTTATGIVGGY